MILVAGLDETEALLDLSDKVQADVAPTLSLDELLRLLPVAAIADEDGNLPDRFRRWAANTVYAIRARVVPYPRNGYVYVAVTSGQSGTVAPTWSTTIDATFADGGVTWRVEDEAGWVPTYCPRRLNKAAAKGCYMKADKLGDGETFSGDGFSDHPETRRDYWIKRGDAYARTGGAGTIDLGGSVYDRYPANVVRVV